MSKKQFEEYLNDMECPDHDHPGRGGRVSWDAIDNHKYGTWLRRHDPIAFEVAYNEHTPMKERRV